MSLAQELTVRKLTPPWFFNTRSDATQITKDFITWWDRILAGRADQAEKLRTMILTPWLVDWDNTGPRSPYLAKILGDYGFGFFGGTNTQAAYLYRLVSSAWGTSTIANFKRIVDAFCLPPFNWFNAEYLPRVVAGFFVPSNFDTGFLIYSTDPAPAAPASVEYLPRQWAAPVGWTRKPSSAQSYARGYIDGENIVWCPVRPISDFATIDIFGSASVPGSVASAGTIVIVDDDGTADRNSVYYSDGTEWRKNSMPNSDLGTIDPTGARPEPEAISVWAPNPLTAGYAITSEVPPPVSGRTGGAGTFFTYAETAVYSGTLELYLELVATGSDATNAIATLIAVLRRVKPANFLLTVKIRIDGVDVPFEIDDMRAIGG